MARPASAHSTTAIFFMLPPQFPLVWHLPSDSHARSRFCRTETGKMACVEVPGEGQSGHVWRVDGCYVKRDAADEHDRLRWLGSRFEVPEIKSFADGWLTLVDVGAP